MYFVYLLMNFSTPSWHREINSVLKNFNLPRSQFKSTSFITLARTKRYLFFYTQNSHTFEVALPTVRRSRSRREREKDAFFFGAVWKAKNPWYINELGQGLSAAVLSALALFPRRWRCSPRPPPAPQLRHTRPPAATSTVPECRASPPPPSPPPKATAAAVPHWPTKFTGLRKSCRRSATTERRVRSPGRGQVKARWKRWEKMKGRCRNCAPFGEDVSDWSKWLWKQS